MLRHRVDLGSLTQIRGGEEQGRIVPKFAPPKVVQMRRDGSMQEVNSLLVPGSMITLCAPVAGGKSTRVPSELSRVRGGGLVVHTIPFGLAAYELGKYLGTQNLGPVCYVDSVTTVVPDSGVVLMSNAVLIGKLLSTDFKDKVRGAVLYLDESHESDCYTAVVRRVAKGLPCFEVVVQATATPDAGQVSRPDLPGGRDERRFGERAVKSWRGDDFDVPWAVTEITSHTCICLDRESTRDQLESDYLAAGIDVIRLTSRSTASEWDAMKAVVNHPNSPVTVVFVDYAYRSSFSMRGFGCYIDSGEVALPVVVEGHGVVKYRDTYKLEEVQFAGRAGRIPGESAVVWAPSRHSGDKICDCEELESDAAALLFRMLGFVPPVEYKSRPTASGPVPRDASRAFLSPDPLVTVPKADLVPWFSPGKPDVGSQRAEFQYRYGNRVSCLTVADDKREHGALPPLPVGSTSILEKWRSVSRERARAASGSDTEPEEQRPKRVARHRRQSTESSVVTEDVPVSPPLGCDLGTASGMPGFAEAPSFVTPVDAYECLDSMFNKATDELRSALADPIPQERLGQYVYYRGMELGKSGLSVLVDFERLRSALDSPDFRVEGFDNGSNLRAISLVVDHYNSCCANLQGTIRVANELGRRMGDGLTMVVPTDKLSEFFATLRDSVAVAQSHMQADANLLRLFVKRPLEFVDPPLLLEQEIMNELMLRLREKTDQGDGDTIQRYLRELNTRKPALLASSVLPHRGRVRKMIGR